MLQGGYWHLNSQIVAQTLGSEHPISQPVAEVVSSRPLAESSAFRLALSSPPGRYKQLSRWLRMSLPRQPQPQAADQINQPGARNRQILFLWWPLHAHEKRMLSSGVALSAEASQRATDEPWARKESSPNIRREPAQCRPLLQPHPCINKAVVERRAAAESEPLLSEGELYDGNFPRAHGRRP